MATLPTQDFVIGQIERALLGISRDVLVAGFLAAAGRTRVAAGNTIASLNDGRRHVSRL